MKVAQRLFNFYLDASVHVALAIAALSWVTYSIFQITVNKHFIYFLFFGSISCYNFIKYGVEAEKYILVAVQYHKNIQFFSFGCLLIATYHAYFLNVQVWFGIGALLLLTGLYALPVLPKAKNLRSWGGLKIFIVALVWAGATVALPIYSVEQNLTWDVYIEMTQRFVFVLVLLVPFEIRDLNYDAPELRTLPQQFGVGKTKTMGALATLLFFFLTYLKDEISLSELITKGILFLCLGSLMFVTKRNQAKYFSSFWVESIPILWLVLLYCLTTIFKSYSEVALSS